MTITKYPFIKGTQCEKSLWLNYYQPEAKSLISFEQQTIMDKGTEVGVLARKLFDEGHDASQGGIIYGKSLIEETERVLQTSEQIFYEPAFQTKDGKLNCRVDILVKCETHTKLIEVKSATSFKVPEYVLDLAFQYYVLKNSNYSGSKLQVYIAYINKEYIRGEHLDVEKLFTVENVTQKIIDAQPLIQNYIRQFTEVLSNSNPNTKVSEACFKPYSCSFFEHCWKDLPPTTVFNISRLRKNKAAKLIEEGIVEPHQIPSDFKLSVEQWTEVTAHKTGKATINKEEIKSFLDSFKLDKPTIWMDFESYMCPIPEFVGTRPYQQICFQYSVLVRDASGNIERKEFLAERGQDPRRSFIKHLLEDTQREGNIIVYNQAFEIARMRELAKEFPEYKEKIEERIGRIKDLLVPFAKKHYYHPMMNGSASIKAVLPVLVPVEEISYKDLSIKNGAVAMAMYERFNQLPLKEQIETRRALLEYCYTDTLGMVKIAEALQQIINQ